MDTPEDASECGQSGSFVVAEYTTIGECTTIQRKVDAISKECGVGSWLPLPYEGRASRVAPVATQLLRERRHRPHREIFRFQLHFPHTILGSSVGEILQFVMGGVAGLPFLRLERLKVPDALTRELHSKTLPAHVALSDRLSRTARPLVQGIIKPCYGLDDQTTAHLALAMTRGGADLIKDDELGAHITLDAQVRRVQAIVTTITRNTTSTSRPLYFAQLSGPLAGLAARIRALEEAGVDGFLCSPHSMGYDTLLFMRSVTNRPIQAHPSCAGIWYSGAKSKLSPAVVLGTLPRLAGATLAMVFTPRGKFRLSRRDTVTTIQEINHVSPFGSMYPVFAGGLHPDHVSELVSLFGPRIILTAGAGILGHPRGIEAGVTAFREAAERATSTAREHRRTDFLDHQWSNGACGVFDIRR